MSNLQDLANAIIWKMKKDFDYMICLSGREGVGKSVMGYHLGKMIDKNFNIKNNIVYNLQEMENKIRNLPSYSAVLIDEGMEVFYKRDWNNKDRKRVIKILSTVRQRNLCFIFCVPRFTDLDEYLRNWRIRCWVKVFARGKGYTYFFDDSEDYGDPWHLFDSSLKWSHNYWRKVSCRDMPDDDAVVYKEIKKESFEKGETETDDRTIKLGMLLEFINTKSKLTYEEIQTKFGIPKATASGWVKKYRLMNDLV